MLFFTPVDHHGKRRTEEKREAARTVNEAGFTPFMASAIAHKHQWVADEAASGAFAGLDKSATWQDFAGRLLVGRAAEVRDKSTSAGSSG